MVIVALAGATTGFGLTVLRNFIHLNKDKKHQIVLLSRSPQPQFASEVDVRPVDYENHEQLVKSLQGVHTLLSFVGVAYKGLHDAQLAMIKAAKEARVKRWAPSEFAGVSNDTIDPYKPKDPVWEATQKSGLEYTRFSVGMFMSCFGTGTPKPPTAVGIREGLQTGEEEALAGMRPWNFVINIRAGTADWAGDGSAPIVWTDIRDIAEFVWRALDLEHWPTELGMRGDIKSFREIVQLLEQISGRKFLIKDNPLDDLEKELENPGTRFYNQVRIELQKGWAMVGDELNKAFPDVKPTTCEEFIQKWWSGVELGEPSWVEPKLYDEREL